MQLDEEGNTAPPGWESRMDQTRASRLFATLTVSASIISACLYFLSSSEVRGYVAFVIEVVAKVLRIAG